MFQLPEREEEKVIHLKLVNRMYYVDEADQDVAEHTVGLKLIFSDEELPVMKARAEAAFCTLLVQQQEEEV